MEYSAAEKEQAAKQFLKKRFGNNNPGHEIVQWWVNRRDDRSSSIAIAALYERNRAVELLRRTTRSPAPGQRHPLWRDIQDFLIDFPEGEV